MAVDTRTFERRDVAALVHPLTSVQQQLASGPLVLQRGRGVRLWDVHGREYIDTVSGLWNVAVGHGRPEFSGAIAAQIDELAYALVLRAVQSTRHRACRARGRPAPGRPGPHLLHQRRLGEQRDGVQAGALLLEPARPSEQDDHHRPHRRLPWVHHRRRQRDRHRRLQGALWPARGGLRPYGGAQPVPAALRRLGPRRLRRGLRPSARGDDPARGQGHRGRLHRRADPGRRRAAPASGRLPAPGSPDLLRQRRPHDRSTR